MERATLDCPVELASLDWLERRVRMEKQETRGPLVNLVPLEPKAKLERRVTLVLQVQLDPQDQEEHQARMGLKATLVQLDFLEIQDPPVNLVSME